MITKTMTVTVIEISEELYDYCVDYDIHSDGVINLINTVLDTYVLRDSARRILNSFMAMDKSDKSDKKLFHKQLDQLRHVIEYDVETDLVVIGN